MSQVQDVDLILFHVTGLLHFTRDSTYGCEKTVIYFYSCFFSSPVPPDTGLASGFHLYMLGAATSHLSHSSYSTIAGKRNKKEADGETLKMLDMEYKEEMIARACVN